MPAAKTALKLREAPHRRAICEDKMVSDVVLNGQVVSQLRFSTHGYMGELPQPDGRKRIIREGSLASYKREIARLNREFRAAGA